MNNPYTRMKIFHFKDKLDSLPLEVDKIMSPIHIRIKPTNICNHNCRYCSYRKEGLQLGKDMIKRDFIPLKKMMEIIENIIDMKVKAVTFSGGGEPFCYPYLFDAAKKLSNSPVKFASLTNGSLLNGKVAELFAYRATWVRISIDGWDDKSYSEYRKTGFGEFSKVMKNIKNFKKYNGKCYLGVNMIIDRKNACHIYSMIQQLRDKGVDSVKIAACIVANSGTTNNKYHKPIFEKVKKEIMRASDRLADDKFVIFDSYHEQLRTFEKDYDWCPYLQILPIIGADLNIYPCQDKAYNLDQGLIGSIKNRTFKDFWFSNKNNYFKINPMRDCKHHCVANVKNRLILDYLDINKEHLEFI